MRSPKLVGRVRGVVVLFDLSIVAMEPRSRMSGASEALRENVFFVKECSFREIVDVFRKPKPWRRSVSVRRIFVGELWRTVSTGRNRGMVDCEVCLVRR